MTEFEKHQLRIILRNNPGITQAEILQHIKDLKMPGNWYQVKISRLLIEMKTNGENIIKQPYYRHDIKMWEYKYYYGETNK